MKYRVSRSMLSGRVSAPGSKSLMQRFIAAALLGRGTTVLRNPQESADAIAALATAELLGADLAQDQHGNYHITGGKMPPDQPLNVGESGLSMRLFTPIAAMSGFEVTITGEGSLLRRPIDAFGPVFEAMGAHISTNNGHLPVTVKGPLTGGTCTLDGSVSSQFLSGLLMALPLAKNDSTIEVKNLKSTPYIDMTLEVLEQFGVVVTHKNYERFHIPGNQHYRPTELVCEGDWSGAAALLVAAAMAGSSSNATLGKNDDGVVVDNLETTYTQADSRITGVLMFAGARLLNRNGSISMHVPKLRGFEFDATDSPDLFPVLAALATACDRPSRIAGVHRLKHKESNRAEALVNEFSKAGITIRIENDELIVEPGVPIAAELNAHGDHRIAMAAALLGLRSDGITISGAEAVEKSFPEFFHILRELGAEIRRINE